MNKSQNFSYFTLVTVEFRTNEEGLPSYHKDPRGKIILVVYIKTYLGCILFIQQAYGIFLERTWKPWNGQHWGPLYTRHCNQSGTRNFRDTSIVGICHTSNNPVRRDLSLTYFVWYANFVHSNEQTLGWHNGVILLWMMKEQILLFFQSCMCVHILSVLKRVQISLKKKKLTWGPSWLSW